MPADAPGRGLVVCPQPYAAEEGARALRRGGNAVDAAVTAAFVQMVVDPQMCSPGGMGQLLVWLAPGERARLRAERPGAFAGLPGTSGGEAAPAGDDPFAGGPLECHFHTRAGSRATPGMWADRIVGRTRFWNQYVLAGRENDVGYGSIMVPGSVAGLWEVHRRFGRLPWAECLAPAIAIAREGFPVRPRMYRYWTDPPPDPGVVPGAERMRATAEARRLYLKPDGSFPFIGETLTNPDVAAVLEAVAHGGADAFYRGDLAARMAADLEANGSTVTAEDLATYRPYWETPLRGTYRGATVYAVVPPGGGLTLLQILNILETYDVAAIDPWAPETVEVLALAMRAAFADREWYVGDPRFVEVPTVRLLSKARAREWRETFDDGRPIVYPDWSQGRAGSTTHVSVVDAGGSAVACTHTLGRASGVVTPGLGFMWNNCMYLFDPIPGTPNAIAPGKARLSGMAPTMVFEGGRLRAVLGAPGGSAITTGVAQVLRNLLDYRMSATEAVSFPRLHAEAEHVHLEGRYGRAVRDHLKRKGLSVTLTAAGFDTQVASVHAIVVRDGPAARRPGDPSGETPSAWEARRLDPGADPRGDGGTAWE